MWKNNKWIYLSIGMVFLSCIYSRTDAQKRVLETTDYRQWRYVESPAISDSGRWITCRIMYQGRSVMIRDERKPVVQVYDTETGRSFDLLNVYNASILPGEEWLYYQVKPSLGDTLVKDSIIFMNLRSGKKKIWNNRYPCFVDSQTGYVNWEESQGVFRRLCIWDILTNDTIKLDSIIRYSFYNRGENIIYLKRKKGGKALYTGKLKGKHILIYNEDNTFLDNYVLEPEGETCVFTVSSDSLMKQPDLLYTCSLLTGKPILAWDLKKTKILPEYRVNLLYSAIHNQGKYIFPVLEREGNSPSKNVNGGKFAPEMWKWDMPVVPSRRNIKMDAPFSPRYVYHVTDKKWILLTDDEWKRIIFPCCRDFEFVLKVDTRPYLKQMDWKEVLYYDLYLKSLSDGKEQLIARELREEPLWNPSGDYALVYQAKEKKWYVLEVRTATWRAVSDDISGAVNKEDFDEPGEPPAYGFAGWVKGRNEAILYDRFDLWVIDLTGKRKSYCLTKGYGRKHLQELRLEPLRADMFKIQKRMNEIDLRMAMLLKSYSKETKSNGFYVLTKQKEVKPLMEGPFLYQLADISKNGKKCLWFRQNYHESPDLWWSDVDFSNPTRVTHANPQQELYRWGTVKVVSWKTFNSKNNEGLLYLPENYDLRKKYPLIVTFYEQSTQKLHRYWNPNWSNATIDIPSFVSDGYAVFIPDIHYTVGEPGESCYDAVVSGIEMLIREGIADKNRIGLQGHSWGGFQAVYLLTRTDMFCCAQPGAAVVDMIAAYSAIRKGGSPRMFMYEITQSRIGKMLWDAPEKYVQNSSILNADRIYTPLLILHNDQDDAVPFAQGLDLYFAMRRMNKPAWLLNYTGEGHFLSDPEAKKDWTGRMKQFFDYYLKKGPLPDWMK